MAGPRIGIVGYSGEPALEAAIRYKQDGELDELWGMNIPNLAFIQAVEDGHFSRWFELHSLSVHRQRKRNGYLRWLGKVANLEALSADLRDLRLGHSGIPKSGAMRLYLRDATELYDTLQFPGEDMAKTDRRFHASSIDWLIRYAIHIKASRIWLMGINGLSSSEPDMSNAGIHYWLARAEARGIEVAAPHSFGILRNVELNDQTYGDAGNPLYGYGRLARQSGNSYELDRYYEEAERLAEVETGEREEMREREYGDPLKMVKDFLDLSDRVD